MDSFGVDWLHTLSLGIIQMFLGHLIRALFDASVYDVAGGRSQRYELSTVLLRSSFFHWYAEEKRAGRTHSEVQSLTPNMLGEKTPCLHVQGATSPR